MFEYQEEKYSQIAPDHYTESMSNNQTAIKVSVDGGVTWSKITVDLLQRLEESGLIPGYLVLHNGERYHITTLDDGTMAMAKEARRKRK
ncbi:hypothetical protein H1S01_16645 [Heliobacterium chlorum]|uniref:Uncharacterized protein n=1 Tax=Heliobacterium chlorum TaxID=2698 RepID=A0ABR7T803_HELCL|nr:hypothetical protein [Heliobacterium chlorum]MBC9786100.1 hypothetical protein [Heliobacterium chlorum]